MGNPNVNQNGVEVTCILERREKVICEKREGPFCSKTKLDNKERGWGEGSSVRRRGKVHFAAKPN